MLHRMKLRVLYGAALSHDRGARRLKLSVILLSGIAVFVPFLIITYYIFSETRALRLMIIGFLAALSCVPVVLYAYAKGFGRPLREIWRERPEEIKNLALKIGFFYGFTLYWMILGIVEFLFGYHSFRAALISFVASAAARDGFEIGYFRAREKGVPLRTIFPDDRSIVELLQAHPTALIKWTTAALLVGGAFGAVAGSWDLHSRYQTLIVGIVAGGISTLAYTRFLPIPIELDKLARFFIWPAFTMACSYFFISAYPFRILLQIQLSPSADLGILMAICSAWITKDTLFLGYLKGKLSSQPAVLKGTVSSSSAAG